MTGVSCRPPADKIRDAASYGSEEVNRVGDATITIKLSNWDNAGDGVTGWHANAQAANTGSGITTLSQSYRDGSLAIFIPWYDEDGNLVFSGGTALAHRPLQNYPDVWPFRVVNTALTFEAEGRTSSHSAIDNHGLGEAWKGIEAKNTYAGGGTLTVRFFSDLEQSDNPGDPGVTHPAGDANYPDVDLDTVPAIAAERGGHWIYAGDGLRGSLNGVPGTFSCAAGDTGYCGLEDSRVSLAPAFTADVGGDPVVFTPDDGGAEVTLPPPRGR